MIVPTRNRAHTFRLVAPSYFAQDGVGELIFVSDAGDDDTPAVIADIAHPKLKTPRWLALLAFTIFAFYRETLRTALHAIAVYLLAKRRSAEHHAQLGA